jgi:hypothetical protein
MSANTGIAGWMQKGRFDYRRADLPSHGGGVPRPTERTTCYARWLSAKAVDAGLALPGLGCDRLAIECDAAAGGA